MTPPDPAQPRLPDAIDLTASLNPEQRAAVTHTGGPCLVLAGAGSGKTRVITHRIAWLIDDGAADPAGIVGLTFTNKAAAEMRARVRSLLGREPEGLWLLTFHALGLRILRRLAGRPGLPRPGFAVYDRGEALSVWRRAQSEEQVDAKEYPPPQLYERCSRAVNDLEDPGAWDREGRPWRDRLAARVWKRYRRALARANGVDFDDLLVRPLSALASDPGLRQEFSERFAHVLVDEYQDTNRLQYRLVRALLPEGGDLMVVGDEDQSIYRWRGADIGNVLDFKGDFPGATVIRLERNYRSTAPILAAAGSLVAHNRERLGKELWTEEEAGDRPLFMLCATERDEAAWVAGRIAAARSEGVPTREIAVLYRTNAQSRSFEEELAGRQVPFRVLGGTTFFRRAEVRDLLAWVRLLAGADDAAFRRAAQSPSRGVGPATLEALAAVATDGDERESDAPGHRAGGEAGPPEEVQAPDRSTATEAGGHAPADDAGPSGLLDALQRLCRHADAAEALKDAGCAPQSVAGLVSLVETVAALRRQLGRRTLPELIRETFRRSGLEATLRGDPDADDRLAHVEELIASAGEFAGDEPAEGRTVAAFLDRAALISDAESRRGREDGVALMTVHAAKGLEFHTVFITGLEERLFPHANAVESGQVEEERRLAYVAMTRARRRLYLSAARQRRVHGRERLQETSRFVGEIDPRHLEIREAPDITAARAERDLRRSRGNRRRGKRLSGPASTPSRSRPSAPPPPPDAAGTGVRAPLLELTPGTAVYHPMFGPGRITESQGSGDDLKLTVEFTKAGRKQILARYAKLQLVGSES